MLNDRTPRPGKIIELTQWVMECDLCKYKSTKTTYQEASIALTSHLDWKHEGWNKDRHEQQTTSGYATALEDIIHCFENMKPEENRDVAMVTIARERLNAEKVK